MKVILIAFLTIFAFKPSLIAQSTVSNGGGDITFNGITVSYTIGQIFYTTTENANIKISEGVQQAYEIMISNQIKEAEGIILKINAFPNPTNRDLTLTIDNYTLTNLSYSLFDISGKKLFSEKIINKTSRITMSDYPVSTYFLKITDSNKEIKTFKIIKTN